MPAVQQLRCCTAQQVVDLKREKVLPRSSHMLPTYERAWYVLYVNAAALHCTSVQLRAQLGRAHTAQGGLHSLQRQPGADSKASDNAEPRDSKHQVQVLGSGKRMQGTGLQSCQLSDGGPVRQQHKDVDQAPLVQSAKPKGLASDAVMVYNSWSQPCCTAECHIQRPGAWRHTKQGIVQIANQQATPSPLKTAHASRQSPPPNWQPQCARSAQSTT